MDDVEEPDFARLAQLVRMTGWVGVNPVDDTEQAHLLLYPDRRGAEAEMSGLALLLGLAPADGDHMPNVPSETTWLSLTDGPDGRSVRLRFGELGVLWGPAGSAWEAVVATQPEVVLWCGLDPARLERDRDVDKYLDRADRVYAGLVRLL